MRNLPDLVVKGGPARHYNSNAEPVRADKNLPEVWGTWQTNLPSFEGILPDIYNYNHSFILAV